MPGIGPEMVTVPFPLIRAGITGAPETVTTSGYASGYITFANNPTADETVTINGTTFTFIEGASDGTDVHIETDLTTTISTLVTILNASVVAGVAAATYSKVGTTILNIIHDTKTDAGNAFTLATNSTPASDMVASGTKLVGGTGNGGVISLATEVTEIAMYQKANNAFTLADGDQGQRKLIYMTTKGTGDAVLTPAHCETGTTTITFNTVGDYAELRFMGTKWYITRYTASLAA